MDFGQLLHKAKKNEQNGSTRARYYSTKFEPPKKLKKENKNLSANIKKFLAKKEAEEQQKLQLENRKKEELLALRAQDKKATRRVNVMLKRTKSANQSVLEEAVDKTHTAVTRAGPEQPDEDDYGYVSQEASALYEKMMQKYSEIPEEPKFNLLKKKVSTNLNSTKDRVKAALDKEKDDAMQPRKRKRRKHQEGAEDIDNEEKGDHDRDSPVAKVTAKPKPRPAAPPPLSFQELLQIAAQKQHEPVVIEEKPQEEEKLYTKKQKRELEKEREWREHRERRQKKMEKEAITPKAGDSKILERQLTKPLTSNKPPISSYKPSVNLPKRPEEKSSKIAANSALKSSHSSHSNGSKLPLKCTKPVGALTKEGLKRDENSASIKSKTKEFPPRDLVQKAKPKEFPPRELKPKQFPPSDVKGVKRPMPKVSKGRILDDDDSEYDSELDDFIDDDPEEGDYSTYIKEIFGYDKSRYRDVDEDVDNMESSFAQQMKEEVISAKIGIKEDLEDMKKEEEDKRRKALMKKKMKR
ncbi:hypothetical protein HUJ04_009454 [Dendroctonus ponderosae]